MSEVFLQHREAYDYLSTTKGPDRRLLASINGVLVMGAHPETFPNFQSQAKPENIDLFFLFKHAVNTLHTFNKYDNSVVAWPVKLKESSFSNIEKARLFVEGFPQKNCQTYLMLFGSLIPKSSFSPVVRFDLFWASRALGTAVNNDGHFKFILETEEDFDGNEQADWA
jgi:hypothetical protein